MSRIPQVQKDKLRRKIFSLSENNQRHFKFQSMCLHLPEDIRQNAKERLAQFNSKGRLVRIKNRCTATGKSRGIIRKFAISQTSLRMLARAGVISGLKKASWLFFSLLLW